MDGYWQYNGALFEAETIARFSHYLRNLLLAVVANPTQPLLQLPIPPIEEEQRLLVEWSRTAVTPPADYHLDLLSKQSLQVPDAIAVGICGAQTLLIAS